MQYDQFMHMGLHGLAKYSISFSSIQMLWNNKLTITINHNDGVKGFSTWIPPGIRSLERVIINLYVMLSVLD